jgi:hypothetical protein
MLTRIAVFAAVFAVGFVLGVVRVLWLVPAIGERSAELAEMPVMVATSGVVAWWLVRRCRCGARAAFVGGVLALVLLAGAELTLVLGVRGLTLQQYVASRDPAAGSAYVAALLLFMLAPAVAAWCLRGREQV